MGLKGHDLKRHDAVSLPRGASTRFTSDSFFSFVRLIPHHPLDGLHTHTHTHTHTVVSTEIRPSLHQSELVGKHLENEKTHRHSVVQKSCGYVGNRSNKKPRILKPEVRGGGVTL
jgi:hypothetical protein